MLVIFHDYICWVQQPGCTLTKNLTDHHALPKHLKPKKNITVPVCKNCHEKINSNDVAGLYVYAYKIEKLADDVKKSTSKLQHNISSYIQDAENEDAKMS